MDERVILGAMDEIERRRRSLVEGALARHVAVLFSGVVVVERFVRVSNNFS